MSTYKKIEELSKEELLSLIYNKMKETLTTVHPCLCAACGENSLDKEVVVDGRKVMAYGFICDKCEEN